MSDCLFCRIAKDEAPAEEYPENVVLLESENFYVKPALGQFVEGYCLVVTKDHYRTMSELDLRESLELEALYDEICRRLYGLYGAQLSSFEHGAVCSAARAGACIDHAHLHVLPVTCDLTLDLTRFESRPIFRLRNLCEGKSAAESYIYWQAANGGQSIYRCPDRIPSQMMRRLISQTIGNRNGWDWRAYPHRVLIQRFLSRWKEQYSVDRAEITKCAKALSVSF